ncbi:MAG: methylmalonyl-CoA decarboxylase [Ideonella sp.]|nr:methylmalonyl-CoA decarboxylase [Ideonella sp.]
MSFVVSNIEASIGTLTLNNPHKRNALSEALVRELIASSEAMQAAEVRVVVLRVAASGARCGRPDTMSTNCRWMAVTPWAGTIPCAIWCGRSRTSCPVIAMVEGGVWGGACEVVLACDVVIAAPSATFAVTPARLGVPTNVSGMNTFMNAANIRIIRRWPSPHSPWAPERAERMGMINHPSAATNCWPSPDNMARVIAGQLAAVDPRDEGATARADRRQPHDPAWLRAHPGLRRIVHDSADYRARHPGLQEKRPPKFSGR